MYTIIVVDDDATNLLLFKHMLAKLPYRLEMAANAHQCLEIARTVTPVLFLIDLHLPEVNGLDLVDVIRREPDWKNTPILMISADGRHEAHQEALLVGCNETLIKPVDRQRLLDTIERLLMSSSAYA